MGLKSPKTSNEIYSLCIEGCKKFSQNEDLYIKPMIWAEEGLGIIAPDPLSSRAPRAFVCMIPHVPAIEI